MDPSHDLTSRAGVVQAGHRWGILVDLLYSPVLEHSGRNSIEDSEHIGCNRPICKTVSDAEEVLDVIVGFDKRDKATRTASKYIPRGGYKQFLNANGLKGKRLGLVRNPFFMFESGSVLPQVFEHHFHTLRQGGAILADHLEIANIDVILSLSEEDAALEAEFKISVTPERTLANVIAFNSKFSHLEKIKEYGEDILLRAQATNGINKKTLFKLARLSKF